MRWDRLFSELEAQVDDLGLEERDALVDDLRDGEWSATPWRLLLGGRVVLEIGQCGLIDGEVVMANERLVHLRRPGIDRFISAACVLAVVSTDRRGHEPSAIEAAWGWGHVLRGLREAGDAVGMVRIDGTARDGTVEVVGKDFVGLQPDAGTAQMVPFAAIAMVSVRT